jgi:hypothetical protein
VLRAGVRGRSVDRSEILMGTKADGCLHEKLATEAGGRAGGREPQV